MKSGGPWNLRGLRPQPREAERDVAQRIDVSVDEWLNRVIRKSGDDAPDRRQVRAATPEPQPPPARGQRDVAPVKYEGRPYRENRRGERDERPPHSEPRGESKGEPHRRDRDGWPRRDWDRPRRKGDRGDARERERGRDEPRRDAIVRDSTARDTAARDAEEARRLESIREAARQAAREEARREAAARAVEDERRFEEAREAAREEARREAAARIAEEAQRLEAPARRRAKRRPTPKRLPPARPKRSAASKSPARLPEKKRARRRHAPPRNAVSKLRAKKRAAKRSRAPPKTHSAATLPRGKPKRRGCWWSPVMRRVGYRLRPVRASARCIPGWISCQRRSNACRAPHPGPERHPRCRQQR